MKWLVRVNWKRFLFQLNILECKWSILYLTVEKKTPPYKLERFFFFYYYQTTSFQPNLSNYLNRPTWSK